MKLQIKYIIHSKQFLNALNLSPGQKIFYHTEKGLEKLDAICMQLIAVGESLKNLDTVSGSSILSEYRHIDWKGAKGMRDIITHHYFNLDAETVFFVCQEKIPPMKACMEQIAADLINGTV